MLSAVVLVTLNVFPVVVSAVVFHGIACCVTHFIVPLSWQLQRTAYAVIGYDADSLCCMFYASCQTVTLRIPVMLLLRDSARVLNSVLPYKSATQQQLHAYPAAWLKKNLLFYRDEQLLY